MHIGVGRVELTADIFKPVAQKKLTYCSSCFYFVVNICLP